jgi:hypothetical protein
MATDNTDNQNNGPRSLLQQVEADLKKAATESVKGKLKDLLKKKMEAEKAVRLIDLEISKVLEDHENGV